MANDRDLFRAAFEASAFPMMITGADLAPPGPVIEFVNEALCELTGYSTAELIAATPRILQGPKTDRVVLDRLKHDLVHKRRFLGETVNYRKDHSEYVLEWAITPILRADGSVAKWLAVQRDVTLRHQRKAILAESEARFRALVEGLPQLVWRADASGSCRWVSPQWEAFTGQSGAKAGGSGWLDAVHPDDLGRTCNAWGSADEQLNVEHRIRRADDGSYRWFQSRAIHFAAHDAGDEWLGVSTDIDDLKRLEAHQQVLLGELQHRSRNLIGVVQSIAGQALDAATSLQDFSNRFGTRLAALSRVQGLLSRNDDEAVPLADIIWMELAARGAEPSDRRIAVSGPAVLVRKTALQTFALAVHELSTNALKHGALSGDTGTLEISWGIDAALQRLDLCWRERGAEVAPSRVASGGYGLDLIEHALPYDLGAATCFVFLEDGIECSIGLPLRYVAMER